MVLTLFSPAYLQFCTKTFATALIGVAAVLGLHASAQAAPMWCNGTLTQLYIKANGDAFVMPSWRGEPVRVCNVNQALDIITPSVCMNWLALARSAVQRQSQTAMYYSDAPSCSGMPPYDSAPPPAYIMLVN